MSGTKRYLPFVAEGILACFGDSSESDPTPGKHSIGTTMAAGPA